MEVLEVKNVSKVYNQKSVSLQALNNINMTVKKGEFIAILGRSGSGKSTLLNILAGLDTPTEGEVFIDGENMLNLKEEKRTMLRREKIGFVFQAYELLSALTVIDNIKLPQLKSDEAYIKELLYILEIEGYEKFYPDQLSGGQQQRVSIARALVNHPSIILADEPTGNLDSKTERIVIELLKNLVKKYKTSIVFVTHNESLVKDVDRIIRLEDGEIINE
ncbi:MAG: ABC transporter ATP-binding protein [Firmicutes bacterium]|uniref:ABC transporter ATP-binding protein n=1 Tax=Candidatus Scybalomonas excrementavium TaxID=2840943 RepID=A0A9D9N7K6_9FIRM|nr:ABC transporter ATP-binding protein [Candidatus Scybalomonas excrementavium]